eukprot:350547-Chlamydomonas_euryale.AAC.2
MDGVCVGGGAGKLVVGRVDKPLHTCLLHCQLVGVAQHDRLGRGWPVTRSPHVSQRQHDGHQERERLARACRAEVWGGCGTF